MPDFEKFTRRMVALSHDRTISILKNGLISLNKAAYAAIGEPEQVELYFDKAAKIIGVRPVPASSPDSYPVRSQRGDTGPYLVAGTAFARYYGLDLSVSRRWIATVDDGVLCADLNTDSTLVAGNNRNGRAGPVGPGAAVSAEDSRG